VSITAEEITFTCGNCGFETVSLPFILEHIKKDDWHCWHKEHGGYFEIKGQPHNCEREYCEFNSKYIPSFIEGRPYREK